MQRGSLSAGLVAMGIVRLSLNKDDVTIPITTWRLRHTGQSDYTSFPGLIIILSKGRIMHVACITGA